MKHNFFHSPTPNVSPRVLWLRSVLAYRSGEMETFILVGCLIAACAVLWIGVAMVDFGWIGGRP